MEVFIAIISNAIACIPSCSQNLSIVGETTTEDIIQCAIGLHVNHCLQNANTGMYTFTGMGSAVAQYYRS